MSVKMGHVRTAPFTSSIATGLIASLCCGGSLVFASLGLGTLWSGFGLSRFIPQALALGALAVVAINYVSYRLAAGRLCAGDAGLSGLKQSMLLSAFFGLAAMAAGFVFAEWLNHGLLHPRAGATLIAGVTNANLLYALGSFAALPLLWALPFPRHGSVGALQWALRIGIFIAAAAAIVFLATRPIR